MYDLVSVLVAVVCLRVQWLLVADLALAHHAAHVLHILPAYGVSHRVFVDWLPFESSLELWQFAKIILSSSVCICP
jgi:hypothetical protein